MTGFTGLPSRGKVLDESVVLVDGPLVKVWDGETAGISERPEGF